MVETRALAELSAALPPLWAVGGAKMSFAVGHDRTLAVGYSDDVVDDAATCAQLAASLREAADRAGVTPQAVAHDLHPELLASRWAVEQPVQAIAVQHHCAHALAALAPDYTRPALAAVFDGMGYGPDGTVWGGELLRLTGSGWQRFATLQPLPLVGGDAATRQPYRLLAGYLTALGLPLGDSRERIAPALAANLPALVKNGINAVPCSSAGRLFDAVSALLGIAEDENHAGSAARALETAAALTGETVALPELFTTAGAVAQLQVKEMLLVLQEQQEAGTAAAVLARSFHHWLASATVAALVVEREKSGINAVALAGGVWHNELLREMVAANLAAAGFSHISNSAIPFDDRGLAVGQLLGAALALRNGAGEIECL